MFENKAKAAYPWPRNLLEELSLGETWGENVRATLECLLSLPEFGRDGQIVLAYYRDDRSYREVGEMFEVSHERVRQIIREMIYKLRHPHYRGVLEHGIIRYAAMEAGKAWRAGYEAGQKSQQKPIATIADECILGMSVDELGLSPRSRNALRRSNLTTLRDVAALSAYQLKCVRGLGEKSRKEILAVLGAWNLRLTLA
jgi:hypothetical protein